MFTSKSDRFSQCDVGGYEDGCEGGCEGGREGGGGEGSGGEGSGRGGAMVARAAARAAVRVAAARAAVTVAAVLPPREVMRLAWGWSACPRLGTTGGHHIVRLPRGFDTKAPPRQ